MSVFKVLKKIRRRRNTNNNNNKILKFFAQSADSHSTRPKPLQRSERSSGKLSVLQSANDHSFMLE